MVSASVPAKKDAVLIKKAQKKLAAKKKLRKAKRKAHLIKKKLRKAKKAKA